MEEDERMQPVFKTKRCDVYRFRCGHRTPDGSLSDFYIALDRENMNPMPACTITVDRCVAGRFHKVLGIDVRDDLRPNGHGLEVVLGLEKYLGQIWVFEGFCVNKAGQEFIASLPDRIKIPKELRPSPEMEAQSRRIIKKAFDEAEKKGEKPNIAKLMKQLAARFN